MTIECPVPSCMRNVSREDFPAHVGKEHEALKDRIVKHLQEHMKEPRLAQEVEGNSASPQLGATKAYT